MITMNGNQNMTEVQYRVFYLAHKLKIDPNVIFYTWTVPEVVVAFAHYINNDAEEAYKIWEMQKPHKGVAPPKKYVEYFNGNLRG